VQSVDQQADRILSLRVYAGKVELIGSGGEHLRFVPAALAATMVQAGAAEVHNANGRVKSIMLVTTAASLVRIGEATAPTGPPAVRFTRKAKLDLPAIIWEHHPRSTYE
jgi:hypothetical protein